RSGSDRSTSGPPARCDRWAGARRRARHDRAGGIRRPRFHADGELPSAGGNRKPVRVHIGFRKRASFDRHSRAAALWNARAKTKVAPEAGYWGTTRSVRTHGEGSRFRRRERADAGVPERERLAFYFEWRETLHHTRRHRARAHGHG